MLEVEGNAPNMILVAVGHDHALNFMGIFPQVGHIGQNDIDPVHSIGGKPKPCIQQNDLILIFKDAGILTDFVETTEGNHFEGGLCLRFSHVTPVNC